MTPSPQIPEDYLSALIQCVEYTEAFKDETMKGYVRDAWKGLNMLNQPQCEAVHPLPDLFTIEDARRMLEQQNDRIKALEDWRQSLEWILSSGPSQAPASKTTTQPCPCGRNGCVIPIKQ